MAIGKFDPSIHPWLVEFVVDGEPASKANRRRFVKIKGKNRFIKSAKALAYVQAFGYQCPTLDPLLTCDLFVAIEIYYSTRRSDLDESIILDAMQGFIYANDRQIKSKFVTWGLDRDYPRAEIKIAELVLD